MSGHHDHDHGGTAVERRTRALESLLVEKGIITTEVIDTYLERMENDIGPLNGARVVARAWVDPPFREHLLNDAPEAIEVLGIDAGGLHLIVVENTPEIHNVVCCTLCSCYPWKLLGLPPTWYKSPAYRSRIVIDPRGVLSEFGLHIPDSVDVRVWDSTSDCRYMVLPERPPGTENLTEDELVALVTRDSMVGVACIASPASALEA
jgi:nitrile hydratase subunit alpha